MWQGVRDSRPRAQIPAAVLPAALFAMFSCRLPSFNELEQQRCRQKNMWRRWLGGPLPCADALAYISERVEAEDLRRCQGEIYATLKRNKVLQPRHGGWMLAAVDGHEIGCSYRRCCEHCLEREIEVGGRTRVQYYHRLVAFQIIARDFHFLFDLELVRGGEDEVAAALRLLRRVLENHPRSFDVLDADAIYLRPSVLELLGEHGKYLIATLKENQPELLSEARTLLPLQAPRLLMLKDQPRSRTELWDMEGFATESIRGPLRVVRSLETRICRERIGGQWQDTERITDWFWATTLPQSLASGEAVAACAHDRWKIENEGFNELATHWHADHYFHHHPNSIVVLWLMLFMAHAVFHCFYRRNLKSELRAAHSAIYFARLMAAELRTANWWPPPT